MVNRGMEAFSSLVSTKDIKLIYIENWQVAYSSFKSLKISLYFVDKVFAPCFFFFFNAVRLFLTLEKLCQT